jgi:hypothetical protein
MRLTWRPFRARHPGSAIPRVETGLNPVAPPGQKIAPNSAYLRAITVQPYMFFTSAGAERSDALYRLRAGAGRSNRLEIEAGKLLSGHFIDISCRSSKNLKFPLNRTNA